MSLFGEFRVPGEAFAFHETLRAQPDLVVEIERVVASDEVIAPYFWITGVEPETFERTAADDPSVRDVRRIDDYERSTLYRAEWTQNVETIIYAYTTIGATILEASAKNDEWELRIRFRNRDRLAEFQAYCVEHDIPFRLAGLFERAHPRAGGQYGLTQKQHDALVTAWEMGYFDSSDVTLQNVADVLEISQQSLSKRLQRGYDSLIGNALAVTPPSDGPLLDE